MHRNLALISGRLTSAPVLRTLPSGTVLATLQVSSVDGDGPAVSVPVSWWDPDELVDRLAPDDEVVVLGRVRRRFYRAGALTASRVEVEAENVAAAGNRRRVRTLVKRAQTLVEALALPAP